MASPKVFVSRHEYPKLHPFYKFEEPLPGLVPAHNVLQAMGFLLAAQTDDQHLADEMLRTEPELIETVLCKNLVCQQAPVCMSRVNVLQDFVVDQMVRENSQLRAALVEGVEDFGWENPPRFVICDRAEFFWGSGLSREEGEGLRDIEWPGMNQFGDHVLSAALRWLSAERLTPRVKPTFHFGIPRLTAYRAGYRGPVCFGVEDWRSHSVLAAFDSYGTPLMNIEAGEILVRRGGRFSDIVEMVNSSPYDLRSYRCLVVHCGANVVQKSAKIRHEECSWFVDWIGAVTHQVPELKMVVSLVVPHETYNSSQVSVSEFNESLKKDLEQYENVRCITWNGGNPFAENAGKRVSNLFAKDDFHLSARGLRVLWKMIVKGSEFEAVPIKVRNETFFEIENRPGTAGIVVVDGQSRDERVVIAPGGKNGQIVAEDAAEASDAGAHSMEESQVVVEAQLGNEWDSDFGEPDIELVDLTM